MMIVDAQIHIWAKGTPSAHHRQEPYSKDQVLAGMDAACVTLFTEELPWLTGHDLDLVMGRAFCDWIGWKLPGS